MFTVYIIQHSFSKELYIGFTTDVEKRLQSHNNGGNRATKRERGEWVLIYTESYRSEHDARVRENKLKQHGSAKHGLKKRIKGSLIEDKK